MTTFELKIKRDKLVSELIKAQSSEEINTINTIKREIRYNNEQLNDAQEIEEAKKIERKVLSLRKAKALRNSLKI